MSLKFPSSPLGSRGEKFKISFSDITTFYAKISIYKLKESGSCINIYLAILGVFSVYHL